MADDSRPGMRRNENISLSVLGFSISAIVVVCCVENDLDLTALDQGWATLVAAFLGLCAIAYQTSVGFKNLKASAVQQSELDRSAREHQAELDRTASKEGERRQAATLAGALSAELIACAGQIRTTVPMLVFQQKIYDHFGELKINHPFEIASHLPKFDPLIYRANVGQLGLLGPSTAHDVVSIYNILLLKPTGSMKDVPASMVATILRGYTEAYGKWLVDVADVNVRLLAVYSGNPDPGPLFQKQEARKKGASIRQALPLDAK